MPVFILKQSRLLNNKSFDHDKGHGKTCDMEGKRLNEGKKKLQLNEESWKLGGSVIASEIGRFLFFKKGKKQQRRLVSWLRVY